MGNKIKITKEQYNRLFGSKLISENHIKDNGGDLKAETIDLIKYLYGVKKDLSPFWEQHGLTFDEICHRLMEKHIVVEKNGHCELSKKLGTPENAKEILEAELKHMLDSKEHEIDEMSNFPPGIEPHTPDAPWNQPETNGEPEEEKRIIQFDGTPKVLGGNEEMAVLGDDGPNLYAIFYGDEKNLPNLPSKKQILNYALENQNDMGEGFDDWNQERHRIVLIDAELKNDLEMTYGGNNSIVKALNSKEGNVDEVTASGSAGAFVGPLGGSEPIKRDLNKPKVPVVAETTSASPATVGPYDANALPSINRDGSYKKTPKTNAEKKTQWSGGAFVNIDDCTRLNNNKKAQNGGCSQGAVDNVVKLKKTKGNVNAPSLNEGANNEQTQ